MSAKSYNFEVPVTLAINTDYVELTTYCIGHSLYPHSLTYRTNIAAARLHHIYLLYTHRSLYFLTHSTPAVAAGRESESGRWQQQTRTVRSPDDWLNVTLRTLYLSCGVFDVLRQLARAALSGRWYLNTFHIVKTVSHNRETNPRSPHTPNPLVEHPM